MEPALEIRMVWENLALAMALWSGTKKGLITKDHFPTGKVVAPTDDGKLVESFNPLEIRHNQELARCVSNQVRGAVTFSALQTHRTLEQVSRNSPLDEADPEWRAARASVYLVSTALCKGMLAPVWVCPAEYRTKFEIPSIAFHLDATQLHGKPVFWEDIGGLEKYLQLLDYCAVRLEDSQVEPELNGKVVERAPEEKSYLAGAGSPAKDPLSDFLQTKCVADPESFIIARELYEAYLGWCQDTAQEPLVQRSFGVQLTKLGFTRKRRGRGRHWWKGLVAAKVRVG